MIEVEGLTKVYGGGMRALDGAAFAVEKGDIFGFLGPNGAGKTTTIRILATILGPTAGTARIDGHDVRTDPMAVKQRIGLMPDEVAFYPNLTGMEHLLYYAEFYGLDGAERRRRTKNLLESVGLWEAAKKKVKTYSHGMKKRLNLAQCLLHDPQVLILDEPASGLDPQGIYYFRELIKTLNTQGKTIFLSSHILTEIERVCNRVGIIDRGRIVALDKLDVLLRQAAGASSMRLEVEVEGVSPDTIAQIAALPGVERVVPTTFGLAITVAPGAEVAPDVSALLVRAGARLRGLRTVQATLEDLFLSLTKGGAA